MITWKKVLRHESAWSVLDEDGNEVCSDLSSIDAVAKAKQIAAERGVTVGIVDTKGESVMKVIDKWPEAWVEINRPK